MQKKDSDPPGIMKTSEEKSCGPVKKFLTRHWKMTLLMIVVIAVAAIVAIFVFLWVVADAQATGLVPVTLGQWTVGYLVIFILNVILWELVFLASWVIPIVLVIYYLWYKKLPDKERKEYEGKHRRKSAEEGSGFSCFVGVIWLVLVWIGGKWNLAFQEWTFNDWVYSWLAACLWGLLVVGILGSMYIIWCLTRKIPKKKS